MSGDVVLRDCSHSDFNLIAEMERSYYREVDPTEAFDEREFQKEFKSALSDPKSNIFVALVEGRFSGFIWLDEYDDLGYITNIHVAKEYRGRGIGKRLLSAAEDYFRAKNKKRLQLEVVESNSTALNLYTRSGFKLTRYEAERDQYTPAGDYLEKSLT